MASETEGVMIEADAEGTTSARSKSRRSIFKRFRKKSSKKQTEEEPVVPLTPKKAVLPEGEEDDSRTAGTATPPLTPAEDDDRELESSSHDDESLETEATPDDRPLSPTTKDGTPVVAASAPDEFLPSEVREYDDEVNKRGESFLGGPNDGAPSNKKAPPSPQKGRSKGGMMRSTVVLKQAPSARDSAFGGPPRYDWIDIETSAAVKVQAAYRRNKVMWELEKEGKSTAAMRNRARAQNSRKKAMQSEDVPFPLACCGVGFLFGDATGEDEAVLEMHRKQEYEEKRQQNEVEEATRRKLRFRRKANDHIVEEVEVVDPEEK